MMTIYLYKKIKLHKYIYKYTYTRIYKIYKIYKYFVN